MKFEEIDILSVGNTIQMAGAIFVGEGKTFLCFFPQEREAEHPVEHLEMTTDDWARFLRQTDLLETEVLAQSSDGVLAKVILRKSSRQVEQSVSWNVYRRDNYACRYCGRNNCPLTVDHLICWEAGGPSIENNLVASCKKCNKTRSNTPYEEWLQHPYYAAASRNLSDNVRSLNASIVSTLNSIPRKIHVNSR